MVAAERDDGFWQAAYRSHGSAVLAFLRRRTGGGDEAEDLLQETFIRAIRRDGFEPGGNLRAYLLSIARNLLIDRARRPRLVVLAQPAEDQQPFENVASDEASPERRAVWAGFSERLAAVLAEMTEAHRQAFELAILQQRSYAEIAGMTGWSLPRVKSNVHRARRKVIDQLGEYLPEERGTVS